MRLTILMFFQMIILKNIKFCSICIVGTRTTGRTRSSTKIKPTIRLTIVSASAPPHNRASFACTGTIIASSYTSTNSTCTTTPSTSATSATSMRTTLSTVRAAQEKNKKEITGPQGASNYKKINERKLCILRYESWIHYP